MVTESFLQRAHSEIHVIVAVRKYIDARVSLGDNY